MLALAISGAHADSAETLVGFSKDQSGRQRDLEERFDAEVDKANIRALTKILSAKPHPAGSPAGAETAIFLAEQLTIWGYETKIEEFDVLLPIPKRQLVELISPEQFRASEQEPQLQGYARNPQDDVLPLFNAYSADGEATAAIVYVNYGRAADFAELESMGVDVNGKIVLARYGKIWRGLKAKFAAQHGALATVLYSDPQDDGYFVGAVIPDGPYRPSVGGERGSVLDLNIYPGDPLTPLVGASKNAQRRKRVDALSLATIPVLPINYRDAQRILENLDGDEVPTSWRGALPITYKTGPGPAILHVEVESDWKMGTAYNVIATLEGDEFPDEWIIRGNHHDAWVYGAADPVASVAALMEEARGVARLNAQGDHPRRTIVFALWDAEEYGMIGSTEWVESHRDELSNKAAVYINSDLYSKGYLEVGGSHILQRFVSQVANDVVDPINGESVGTRLLEYAKHARSPFFNASSPEIQSTSSERIPMMPLGGGTDFVAFLDHLGVASLQVGYFGEGLGGEIHSAYDTFAHFEKYSDPGFEYGATMVRTTGRMVLRLANSTRLPFEYTDFALNSELYASQIQQQSEIDLKDLHNAISVFCQSATRFDQYARTVNLTRHTLEELGEINNFLFRFERKLAVGDGLPGRPWYRHRIYAPGTNTGYDVKTLPVLREAVEARSWHEAAAEAESLSKLYLELGSYLDAGARDHFGFGSESVRQAWEVGDGACTDSGPADDDGVP